MMTFLFWVGVVYFSSIAVIIFLTKINNYHFGPKAGLKVDEEDFKFYCLPLVNTVAAVMLIGITVYNFFNFSEKIENFIKWINTEKPSAKQ